MRRDGLCLLCAFMLMALCQSAHAGISPGESDRIVKNLPELPAVRDTPGRFSISRDNAMLGYRGSDERWTARVGNYVNADPLLAFDYAMLMSRDIGIGGSFTRSGDYSEAMLSGLLAPAHGMRVRIAGGQLRSSAAYSGLAGNGADGVVQNNYLLHVRKVWDEDRLLSNVGLSAFTAEAHGPNAGGASSPQRMVLDANGEERRELAMGRLDAMVLNLSLRPTGRSRIDLSRELGSLTYFSGIAGRSSEQIASERVGYSYQLDSCTTLTGQYNASQDSARASVGLAMNNWTIGMTRFLEGDGVQHAVELHYRLPLGAASGKSCHRRNDSERLFQPLMDAAVGRPREFPSEPLVRVDSASASMAE